MAKHSKPSSSGMGSPQGTKIPERPLTKKAIEAPTEPTTRICIKNVPPSIQETSQIKKFLFSSQEAYFPSTSLTITDCRILNKRRMAFIGFQTKDCASSCVKYLNGSYWKTTKIVVEFAFPPKENTKKTEAKAPNSEKNTKEIKEAKTKKVDSAEKKKKEFLNDLGFGKKGGFWANDDDGGVAASSEERPVPQGKAADASDSSSNDDYDEDNAGSVDSAEDDAEPLFESHKGVSDLDFLRAKTVRVEELPEDVEPPDSVEQTKSESDENECDSDEEVEMKIDRSEKVDEKQTDTPKADDDEPQNSTEEISPRRLFVRNLPFSVTEDDLSEFFGQYGTLDECYVPVDDFHRTKGFAFVSFRDPDRAANAREESDGKDFQGRIIQVLPARPSKTSHNTAQEPSTYKEKQEMEKQNRAGKDQTGWSASFVRGDAVVDNLASRLGLKKGDVLGVKDGLSAGDAAVRLALGETAVIEENRKYFAAHGIDMEALVSLPKGDQNSTGTIERSKTSILVKNLPADTTKDELLKTFGLAGVNPTKVLLPPSRTIAVIEYAHSNEAKSTFKKLAYRRFRDVPLYLEWAPLSAQVREAGTTNEVGETENAEEVEDVVVEDSLARAARPTLYVKNLNFSTSEEELHGLFSSVTNDVKAVRIPKKVAPAKRVAGKVLREETPMSMGFGFVEFGSKDAASKAIEKLQGKMLAGHTLQLEPTKQTVQSASASIASKKKSSKLLVRNVPFQANRKELLTLFGSFGQLKKVRLPKKFDGNHRGFAFIDYVSSKEAAEAMKTLSKTHLYGRHLVIEWATETESETVDAKTEESSQPKNKKIRFT
eukprot:scaffold2357_cov167-Amphora_coffeaeformis.AAC.28